MRPARSPLWEDDQLLSATARLANPLEYASFEFSAHHGARSSFASFQILRRPNADHDTAGVS
ncbi:MAG: hypothetical protein ACRDRI_07835 [Pseudonocardiaceae bacterium]